MHYQWGGKTPKIAPYPWDFVTLPQENRAIVIGNMHKKIGNNCACGSGDMLAGRQTQTCSSQYFTTALMGEVTIAFYSTNTTALTTCAEDE